MNPKPSERQDDGKPASNNPPSEEPGTNAVEHEPDPKAEPLPEAGHKYVPKSPFTTGNY